MARTSYSGPTWGGSSLSLRRDLLEEDRSRQQKQQSADLALALEEQKLKKAKADASKQETIDAMVEEYVKQSNFTPTPIEPGNHPYQTNPKSFGESGQVTPNPVVRQALFGKADIEFPGERRQREEERDVRTEKRQEGMQSRLFAQQNEALATREKGMMDRMEGMQRETNIRQIKDKFALSTAAATAARDRELSSLSKQFGMYANDPKSTMYKQWQSGKRAALSNWRHELEESKLGYKIMMNGLGMDVPDIEHKNYHTVELEAMQERLDAIDPNWMMAQGDYSLPAILKIATSKGSDPFRIIQLIEEEYQAAGGKMEQAQQPKRNRW